MYLIACERLASKEPTLGSLLERLDQALADMGPHGEIVANDLAYMLEDDVDRVEGILGELVQLGGLEQQDRFFCRNGCHAVTSEEYQEACDEGASPRCPVCNSRIESTSWTRRAVYVVREGKGHVRRPYSRPTDGRPLTVGKRHKMLFTAANARVDKLALDDEWHRIESRFSQKKCRVEIVRVDCWATTSDDLRQAILDEHPVVVHFSGHGKMHHGLGFSDGAGGVRHLTGSALAGLFQHFKFIQCVVLNACHSVEQARAIAPYIHCVVGMSGEIGDDSAIQFSAGFYDGLTAGEPFGRCFDLGVNAINLANLTHADRPTVWIDGTEYPLVVP